MTPAEPGIARTIQYSRRTIDRAERAVRCAPFKLPLFTTMRWQGVALAAISGKAGVQNRYTLHSLAEIVAEHHLLWLIQVGLLRREVDGQGLTNSFRLTPLGQQLVEKWQQQPDHMRPSLLDRLLNTLSRWVRLLSWLQ
jgi:hypothetical protein